MENTEHLMLQTRVGTTHIYNVRLKARYNGTTTTQEKYDKPRVMLYNPVNNIIEL